MNPYQEDSITISDEIIDATAKALVMERTGGLCDEWPKACADCDCFRDQTEAASAAYDRSYARAVLAAALPLIRDCIVNACGARGCTDGQFANEVARMFDECWPEDGA